MLPQKVKKQGTLKIQADIEIIDKSLIVLFGLNLQKLCA